MISGFAGKPEDDNPYVTDHKFLRTVQDQVNKIANSPDLPKAFKYKYDERLTQIETLRNGNGAGKDSKKPAKVKCSLVKSIHIEDIEQIPGLKTVGNVLIIPEFGIVALAEVEVGTEPLDPAEEPRSREVRRGRVCPQWRLQVEQLLPADHARDGLGLHWPWARQRGQCQSQRPHQAVVLLLFAWLLACALSCTRGESAQTAYERIEATFLHGNLQQSQVEADGGYQRFRLSSPQWAWRFRILEARSALWRGMYEEVLRLLASQPGPPHEPGLKTAILMLEAIANARLQRFPEAEARMKEAEQLCASRVDQGCGEVLQARGLMFNEHGQFEPAREAFKRSMSFARAHGDQFLESTSLLNLGLVSLKQERFDEAIESSQSSYRVSTAIGAADVALVAEANLGWAYYKLGDSEKALQLFQTAEKNAAQLGDIFDQENELTNIGYIYLDSRKFDLAAQSFQRALGLAEGIKAKQDIYNVLRVLARLAVQAGNVEQASDYAQRALDLARQSANHPDELYPLLVQAQLAARRGDGEGAESKLLEVERDPGCPVFLKWEAERLLAQLYVDQNRSAAADREFRAALATFEAARDSVRHEDSKLSFLTNGSSVYDDYIDFLVARGKTNDALRWADHSRARTLAEGLGLLGKASTGPPALNAQEVSRRAGGALLFYWLGDKRSYLWAITSHTTRLFPLPAGSVIDAAVERYREALAGPQDVLDSGNPDSQWLYRTLIAPVRALLPQDAKVVVIPDSSLNNLNFETLIVSEPKLHYWIEDATIADASSLQVLAGSHFPERKRGRRLLLVGDSVAPSKEYPELPKAAAQMESVARNFPEGERRILSREQATPAAYIESNPESFSHIHFVAHGTASRLSPLDSAIVLSKGGAENSFKLYARDIIRHPLRANLVTISACYGAGERSYAGEGLVGLSWAFLRAGAHNVIAALWEAADTSTEKLMAQFYEELDHGASPGTALRAAKLSLLHSSDFRSPFYWAPFQLYTQGRTDSSHYAGNSPTTRKTRTEERQTRSRPSTSTRAPG